jgi:predicted RNA binding protein YcfA (HicA-like mRNA interferase family)
MSKHEKALQRLASKPVDFKWSELVRAMESLGYILYPGSGSRRRFKHPKTGSMLNIHEPHPNGILKAYQVRDVLETLQSEGYL